MEKIKSFLATIIRKNISSDGWNWLENEAISCQTKTGIAKFNIAFVAMPRKTGKKIIAITSGEIRELKALRKDFSVTGWSIDRLCRVWLILHLESGEMEKYTGAIENLFLNAEMSELVALYSSLPLLAYPEFWKKRCAEGIRSNIGQVLESIICDNPYGAEQLDEAAWNQLVLKAIFTEKSILNISGLQERMNPKLATSLCDYAHERWAAHRTVNPLLWMFVSPYINEKNFPDMQRIFSSEDPIERKAAALACYQSGYSQAKDLLGQDKELKNRIERGELNWITLAKQMEKVEQ